MVIIVRKGRLFRVDNLVRVINENQNIVLMLVAANAVLFLVGIFIYSDIYYYERDFFSYQQSVYADGLTQENLPPASLGDREGKSVCKDQSSYLYY
jgi:TRAP-type C4-dicarboxylate transport system permease small subunit